jgi:hypothetical protein
MSFEDDTYSSVSWDTGATDYFKPEDLLNQVVDKPPSQDLTSSTSSNADPIFSVCLMAKSYQTTIYNYRLILICHKRYQLNINYL